MNDRAKELGCTNTHFANTNGLQADDHYTSAYDLALISKAFFDNDLLCRVGNTPRYHFTATSTQPDDFYLNNKHKLISGEISYDGILGGKTGYTDLARETLVTCAEKNGMKLICVVFMEESPAQFTDTVTLFDYGFNNFQSVNVADNDARYMPNDAVFFESDNDVFGHSGTILKLAKNDSIIIPRTQTIEDTDYDLSYDLTEKELAENPTAIARVSYTYHGEPVGKAYVCYQATSGKGTLDEPSGSRTIYINVRLLLICAGVALVLLSIAGGTASRLISGKGHSSRYDRVRYNRRKKEYKKGKFKSGRF
jgi:D-alanyl-D-alanine carboxypeptidase/D-alanyl-D-alanine carboxypeptidase (penicillin-binding protein 5/6)